MPGQLCEQIKHISAEVLHTILQTIKLRIVPRGRERVLRHIHRDDGCRARRCAVEAKGTGVGEAVEHALARRELRRRAAVILLVEKETGFLPVDIIHIIQDPVFPDRHMSVQFRLQSVERHETGPLLHALFLSELDVVALVDRVDLFAARAQRLQQEYKQLHFSQLHAQ